MCYRFELNGKNHLVDDAVYLPGGVEEVVAEFLTEAFQRPFLCLEEKTTEHTFKPSNSTVRTPAPLQRPASRQESFLV